MTLDDLGALLARCREGFGSPPRRLSWLARFRLRLRLSSALHTLLRKKQDKLNLVLRDQSILHEHGRVVWGSLVQVNDLLFNPNNKQTCPGNVLYSPDAYFDDHLSVLRAASHGIFDLKDTYPDDPEASRFALAVTDELLRTMRLPLPRRAVDDKEVFFTSCFFQPSHLPGGRVVSGFFPILICPERTEAVLILPERYWPAPLRTIWLSNAG